MGDGYLKRTQNHIMLWHTELNAGYMGYCLLPVRELLNLGTTASHQRSDWLIGSEAGGRERERTIKRSKGELGPSALR